MERKTWETFVISFREKYGKNRFTDNSVAEWAKNLKHLPDNHFEKAYQELIKSHQFPFYWGDVIDKVDLANRPPDPVLAEGKAWAKDNRLVGFEEKRKATADKMLELMTMKKEYNTKIQEYGDFFIEVWGKDEAKRQVREISDEDNFMEFKHYILRNL